MSDDKVLVRYDEVDDRRSTARVLLQEAGERRAEIGTVSEGFLVPRDLAESLGLAEPQGAVAPEETAPTVGEAHDAIDEAGDAPDEPADSPDPDAADLQDWLSGRTVPQVVRYMAENPADAQEIKDNEARGQNRKGIVEYKG